MRDYKPGINIAISGIVNGWPKQIIIAYVEMTGLKETGKLIRPDGVNYRKEFIPAEEAKAAVWLLQGNERDERKAVEHAKQTHSDKVRWEVFAFPAEEMDPLGRARKAILGVVA